MIQRGLSFEKPQVVRRRGAPEFRIKWLLWHGNLHRASRVIKDFEAGVDALDVDYPNLRRFAKATHELAIYIGQRR
jgi:hypothetical protein